MVFSLLPILSLLVSGVEADGNDESTLLQVMDQKKLGSDWGALKHSSLDEEAPVDIIYIDSKTEYVSPRKRLPTQETKKLGIPMDLAFRFKDLEKQGIVVNATHAVFPFEHIVQAQFLRKNRIVGTREFGVANMRWQPKLPGKSVMEFAIGSAEKLHTLYHKGKGGWREDSVKYAFEDQEHQTALAGKMPKPSDLQVDKTRNATFLSLVSRLGMQFVRAASDPSDIASVAPLAGKRAPERFLTMKERLQTELGRNDAKITSKVKGKDTPEATGNNCFHLQDSSYDGAHPPVVSTSDGYGFAVRLDTLVQSFRGETTLVPLEAFQFTRGGMVFSYDLVANELWAYHQSSSLFRAEDIDGTHLPLNPTFYLGSLLPRSGALEPDGRRGLPPPADEEVAVYKKYQAMPMDYKHMFSATCPEGGPDSKYAKAKEAISSFDQAGLVNVLLGRTPYTVAERDRILLGIADTIAVHLDCMSGWLKSSIPNSHGFGLNAAFVMVHMMIEMRPLHLADIVLDPNWNQLDLNDKKH